MVPPWPLGRPRPRRPAPAPDARLLIAGNTEGESLRITAPNPTKLRVRILLSDATSPNLPHWHRDSESGSPHASDHLFNVTARTSRLKDADGTLSLLNGSNSAIGFVLQEQRRSVIQLAPDLP